MNIEVVSIEEGPFDKTLNITTDTVILTDGYLTIEGKGVVWDNFTEEELEELFYEWIIFAKEGEDGFNFV